MSSTNRRRLARIIQSRTQWPYARCLALVERAVEQGVITPEHVTAAGEATVRALLTFAEGGAVMDTSEYLPPHPDHLANLHGLVRVSRYPGKGRELRAVLAELVRRMDAGTGTEARSAVEALIQAARDSLQIVPEAAFSPAQPLKTLRVCGPIADLGGLRGLDVSWAAEAVRRCEAVLRRERPHLYDTYLAARADGLDAQAAADVAQRAFDRVDRDLPVPHAHVAAFVDALGLTFPHLGYSRAEYERSLANFDPVTLHDIVSDVKTSLSARYAQARREVRAASGAIEDQDLFMARILDLRDLMTSVDPADRAQMFDARTAWMLEKRWVDERRHDPALLARELREHPDYAPKRPYRAMT